MEMYAFFLKWSARSVENVNVPDEDASAATVPAKSRKGRKGIAIESCFQEQGSRMVMERLNCAYSYADRQGFEVEDVQDLDCERGEGYFYRVRHFLTVAVSASLTIRQNVPCSVGVSLRLRTTLWRMSST
jgi:hypothetical protein